MYVCMYLYTHIYISLKCLQVAVHTWHCKKPIAHGSGAVKLQLIAAAKDKVPHMVLGTLSYYKQPGLRVMEWHVYDKYHKYWRKHAYIIVHVYVMCMPVCVIHAYIHLHIICMLNVHVHDNMSLYDMH